MDRFLRDLPHFVEVARQKSFTLAADALGVPISTLSRRITAMEKELGVSLFKRNTRSVELTESGEAFYRRCAYILSEVETARDKLVRDSKKPSGLVRVSMPSDIYHGFLSGVLGDFALQYPDIRLEVSFSNRWADLTSEPFDLEIRTGELPDSNLRARRLFNIELGVYAAPSLLELYPEPREPEDLQKIPCISKDHLAGNWVLHRDGEQRRVALKFAHHLTGGGLMAEFLVFGLGAALAPPRMMAPFEKHGLIRRILPEWSQSNSPISLVLPDIQLTQRVRLFADYLAAHFASPEIRMPNIEPLILHYLNKK